MQKRLVLFDIDETMISSDGAGRRAIAKTLGDLYRIGEDALQIPMSGKTDPQILTEILEASGMMREEILALIDTLIETYLTHLKDEIASASFYIVHEGVRELIGALLERDDAYLGLLTGNVERGARMKLDRFALNQHFPVGAYGSDAHCRLELPPIAKQRADFHYGKDFLPDEIVIIGDSINDVLCAKSFGAVSLAVNTGKTSWKELEDQLPDHLFPSLKDTDAVMTAIFSN